MSRPKQITIAAILLLLLSLLNAASDSQVLQGPAGADFAGDLGAYAWSAFNFITSVAGLIAAFALWRNISWGKGLALIVSAISILNILIGIFSGQLPLFAIVMGSIFAALYLLVVVLVLRYAPLPAEFGQ